MRDCMCRGARASAMQTHHDILDTPVELDSAMEAHAEQETAPVAQPSAKTQAKTQVQAENNAQVVFAAAEQALAEHPFTQLGLMPELVRAVADLGYTQPTTVQAQVIPKSLHGDSHRDLMVSSQTGSGKTAAFLLPILHDLENLRREKDRAESQEWSQKIKEAEAAGLPPPKKPRRHNPTDRRHFKAAQPQALILCPTRELAQQVAHDAIDLVQYIKGVRIASIIGGLPYAQQVARLQNASLVVATPGRLLDLERGGQIKLDQVQYLVLDEADRMLDLGFAEDLEAVHALTEKRSHTLMFSATFAPRIQSLAANLMRQPERIQIDSPQERHANIAQTLYWADHSAHRRKLLDHMLRDTAINQAIVFASTQVECDGLAQDLADAGFSAAALHGALSQGMRNRRLGQLRDGRIQFLVATDVAARGIDVATISHVFNYGLPMKAEDYVHRIGRTGRAGREGIAITIAEFRDRFRIKDIEFYTKQVLSTGVIPGLEPKAAPPQAKKGFGGAKGGGSGRGGFKSGGAGRSGFGGGFADRDRPRFDDRPAGRFGGDRQDERFADRDRPQRRFDDKPASRFDNERPQGRGDERFSSNRSFTKDSFSGRFDGQNAEKRDQKFGAAKPSGAGRSGHGGHGAHGAGKKEFADRAGIHWVGAKAKKGDFRKRRSD